MSIAESLLSYLAYYTFGSIAARGICTEPLPELTPPEIASASDYKKALSYLTPWNNHDKGFAARVLWSLGGKGPFVASHRNEEDILLRIIPLIMDFAQKVFADCKRFESSPVCTLSEGEKLDREHIENEFYTTVSKGLSLCNARYPRYELLPRFSIQHIIEGTATIPMLYRLEPALLLELLAKKNRPSSFARLNTSPRTSWTSALLHLCVHEPALRSALFNHTNMSLLQSQMIYYLYSLVVEEDIAKVDTSKLSTLFTIPAHCSFSTLLEKVLLSSITPERPPLFCFQKQLESRSSDPTPAAASAAALPSPFVSELIPLLRLKITATSRTLSLENLLLQHFESYYTPILERKIAPGEKLFKETQKIVRPPATLFLSLERFNESNSPLAKVDIPLSFALPSECSLEETETLYELSTAIIVQPAAEGSQFSMLVRRKGLWHKLENCKTELLTTDELHSYLTENSHILTYQKTDKPRVSLYTVPSEKAPLTIEENELAAVEGLMKDLSKERVKALPKEQKKLAAIAACYLMNRPVDIEKGIALIETNPGILDVPLDRPLVATMGATIREQLLARQIIATQTPEKLDEETAKLRELLGGETPALPFLSSPALIEDVD